MKKRSAPIDVANFSDDVTTFDVQLDWPAGQFPGVAKLKVVRFTECQGRWIANHALPAATQLGHRSLDGVELPVGVTSQLWLSFDTTDVLAG